MVEEEVLTVCGCALTKDSELQDVDKWDGVVGMWAMSVYRVVALGDPSMVMCYASALSPSGRIYVGHPDMTVLLDGLRGRIWDYTRRDARAVQLPEVMKTEDE